MSKRVIFCHFFVKKRNFCNFLVHFALFCAPFFLPILPKPRRPTPSPPFLAQKPLSHPKINRNFPKKPHFLKIPTVLVPNSIHPCNLLQRRILFDYFLGLFFIWWVFCSPGKICPSVPNQLPVISKKKTDDQWRPPAPHLPLSIYYTDTKGRISSRFGKKRPAYQLFKGNSDTDISVFECIFALDPDYFAAFNTSEPTFLLR